MFQLRGDKERENVFIIQFELPPLRTCFIRASPTPCALSASSCGVGWAELMRGRERTSERCLLLSSVRSLLCPCVRGGPGPLEDSEAVSPSAVAPYVVFGRPSILSWKRKRRRVRSGVLMGVGKACGHLQFRLLVSTHSPWRSRLHCSCPHSHDTCKGQ